MKWRGPVVLGVLALGACSHVPQRSSGPGPAERAAMLGLDQWQASGRIAVRTAQDGFSAHFDWRQAGSRGELGVRGPFGAGAVRVSITPELIRIESGAEPLLEVSPPYESVEPLLSARLGFPLPLESLRYWMLGIPAPVRPGTGDGPSFDQDGWHVAPSEFGSVERAPGPLPARLDLTRGSSRIRVIIERWQVGGP